MHMSTSFSRQRSCSWQKPKSYTLASRRCLARGKGTVAPMHVSSALAALVSNSGLLELSIRHIWIQRVHTVNPHGACLHLVRDLDSACQVLHEKGGREAIKRP